MKRTIRKKREFTGWGSTSLIEFLISIDKDPSQTCSLIDLSNIINGYITKNQLTDRVKKKRVVCDERLLSILGKRTVNRTKILDLLEPHLLEFQDSSEEDELSDDMEEGEGASKPCKRQRKKGLDKTNGTSRFKVAPRSCFASIVTQNIKLVYVQSDWKLWTQKASETGDSSTGIILQLSSRSDSVQIRMLSDDDFTEWDLEGKARWIEKELALLRNLIDRASEKGWHREYPS
ncbi:hypothetical protein MKW92_017671 [Papaver armeniacum]|nr:hypothetical protein MKW92_017671 [Papaver armeniacum]